MVATFLSIPFHRCIHIHKIRPCFAMQSRSLPSYFNSDHSPMMSSDSPFPPLKTEHRYRGVYERAGFDVNLASGSLDARSFYLKKSTSSSNGYGRRIGSESTSNHGQGRTASSHSFPLLAPPVASGEHKRHFRGNGTWDESSQINEESTYEPKGQPQNAHYPRGYTSAPSSAREVTSGSIPTLSSAVSRTSSSNDTFQLPKRSEQRPTANLQQNQHQTYQQFQPFQPVKAGLIGGGDKQHYRPDGDRNIKNLSLRIHDSNFSSPSMPAISTDSLSGAESSTFDDQSPFNRDQSSFKRQTPQTSASSTEHFVRKNSTTSETSVKTSELTSTAPYPLRDPLPSADKDLSEVLGDFRKEVEEHRKYDPRSRGAKNLKQPEEAMDYGSQNFQHPADDFNNSSQDESFRFDSSRQSYEPTDASNHDFENFLQASERKNHARNSQLSTISSIISRPTHSDDEDGEVEAELERQLESLKTGSDTSGSSMKLSDDSFVTALNYQSDVPQNVPSFKIDIASQVSGHESSDSDTETEAESGALSRIQEDTTFDQEEYDEFAPLSFQKHKPSGFADAPRTPIIKSGYEDQFETPETIMPLSPKNHRVNEELKDINFKGANTPEFNSGVLESLENEQRISLIPEEVNDDEILLQNPTPSEFNAFPKSVVGMEVPNFRVSTAAPTHSSGEGPCRVCHEEIDPNARGSQKAIYSKSGDMSGQWHRGCFSCAYAGCNVKFNKNVACYVLLDNVFCHDHYHSLNGTRCQSCNLGIEGECIENELKQKWHVSCIKCTKCHSPIQSDYFLINSKIFCDHDAAGEIQIMETHGVSTNDKIEKRRTRMLFIDQQVGM